MMKELASSLEVNRSTITRHLKELTDNGVISREGADKNGTWKINEKEDH